MRRYFKDHHVNNKGFSLVELMIAVALVAIVGTAVFGFMSVGAKTFTSTSSDVNLQSESQLAFNQMQDIIIDTAVGIDYMYAPAGADPDVLTNYNKVMMEDAATATAAGKKLVMYNTDRVYELTWKRDTADPVQSKLYYSEFGALHTGSNTIERDMSNIYANNELMAEYITDFKVDLSRMKEKRIVRIETTYEKGNKEYSSSHNITLRNKPVSGNEIPPYVEPVPVALMGAIHGPTEIYIKPGETFDISTPYYQEDSNGAVYHNTLYFDVVNGTDKATNTAISPSGVLYVSQGQKKDFTISISSTVSSHSYSTTVHIMRVTGITITPTTTSILDETGTGRVYDNLIKDEEFELSASVYGDNIDETSITGSTVDKNVSWAITKGDAYFDMISSDGTSCVCKMKTTFTLTGATVQTVNSKYSIDDIEVTATSNESVNNPQRYMDFAESAYEPVTERFNGYACTSKGDFNIDIINEGGGKMHRGERNVIHSATATANQTENIIKTKLVMPDGTEIDWNKYCGIVDLTIIETLYNQDGSTTTRQLTDYGNDVTGEGANWNFTCPMRYNPNADYTYSITLHLCEVKNPGEQQQIFVSPKAGYTSADYKYSSNTVNTTFKRLILQYQYGDNNKNFIISDNKENASYYPRSFDVKEPPSVVKFLYTYDDSFKTNDGSWSARKGWNIIWKWYTDYERTQMIQGEDGSEEAHTYNLFDDTTEYSFDNNIKDIIQGGGSNGVEFVDEHGGQFRYTGHKNNKWKSVASSAKLVPVFVYDGKDEYVLFDNSIDVYFHNIDIPGTGMIAKLVNNFNRQDNDPLAYERSYFPSPLDVFETDEKINFPGASSDKSWTGACSGYTNWNFPNTFHYTISLHGSGGGRERYDLTLSAQDKVTNKWVPFAKYYCYSDDRNWTLEEIIY